jgi:hypothetical protein
LKYRVGDDIRNLQSCHVLRPVKADFASLQFHWRPLSAISFFRSATRQCKSRGGAQELPMGDLAEIDNIRTIWNRKTVTHMRNDPQTTSEKAKLTRKEYEEELRKLQVELCKLQAWVKHKGFRIIVAFEGRDAPGKGGLIKALWAT